ncbi:MAG: polysaccharide deacetylase family protein [Xenophilus sp.]
MSLRSLMHAEIPGARIVRFLFWGVLAVLLLFWSFRLAMAVQRDRFLPVFHIQDDHLVPEYESIFQYVDRIAGRHHVLLTFDDGPYGKGVDEEILRVLRKHRAKAIFFVVCGHIHEATRPVLREMRDEGHWIGNHSDSHPDLTRLDGAMLDGQIEGCSRQLEKEVGYRPPFFRPPFGRHAPAVDKAVSAAGMQLVLWDANSQDSWRKDPADILHWSRTEAREGSILLMHSTPWTAGALDRTLTALEDIGVDFVSVAGPRPAPERRPPQARGVG